MKTITGIISALIITGALAEDWIIRTDDGAGVVAIGISKDSPKLLRRTGTHTSGCDRDNCLRAMVARATAATPFCYSYTTQVQTTTTSLGPWQTQCGSSPSRVSSACSCVVSPSPAPTCMAIGKRCTLENFVNCCTQACYFGGDINAGRCFDPNDPNIPPPPTD
ncbi:hypothetical protein TWF281_008904 [Arthrobotrys megalospora]